MTLWQKKKKKNLPVNAGDMGSIPGLGKSPGEGNGNPFQHSCLGNPMDSRTWQATVHGVSKSQTELSNLNNKKSGCEGHNQLESCFFFLNYRRLDSCPRVSDSISLEKDVKTRTSNKCPSDADADTKTTH